MQHSSGARLTPLAAQIETSEVGAEMGFLIVYLDSGVHAAAVRSVAAQWSSMQGQVVGEVTYRAGKVVDHCV
jgi:hypothetical protein